MSSESPGNSGEATKQVVVFVLDNEKYAVPIHQIKEVIRTAESSPVPGSPPFIIGVMNLRGQVISVIDLEKLLNLVRVTPLVECPVIIVDDTQGKLFGIRVDQVMQILKVTDDMIQPTPTMVAARVSPDYVEGVIVLKAPGEAKAADVLLLLNLQKIVTQKVVATAVSDTHLSAQAVNQPQQKEGIS